MDGSDSLERIRSELQELMGSMDLEQSDHLLVRCSDLLTRLETIAQESQSDLVVHISAMKQFLSRYITGAWNCLLYLIFYYSSPLLL